MKVRARRTPGQFFGETPNNAQKTKSKPRAKRFGCERLETRLLFVTNAWAGGFSGDWDTLTDWSLGHVPLSTENVSIAASGSYTMTHSVNDADSFNSLSVTNKNVTIDLTSGSLTETATLSPSTTIQGALIVNGGNLSIAGGTLTATGSTTLPNTTISASSSGVLNFTTASSLTSVNLNASGGGQILFPAATSYASFENTVDANGTGSKISLADLATFTNGSGFSTTFTASSGGEIDLTGQFSGPETFTLPDASSLLNVGGITTVSDGVINATSGTINFSGVTTLNNVNLSAMSGGQILFPKATSYASFENTVDANGTGSKISLADLATFTNGSGFSTTFTASSGGEIDFAGAMTGAEQFSCSGSGSTFVLEPGLNIYSISTATISGGGTIDITNNELLINYGGNPDPISTITAAIYSGYNGGLWNGTGIISSLARTPTNGHDYGVGYADAADPFNPAGLPSGEIKIMYTLLGDANLDGVVNATDFSIVAGNFNKGLSGWDQGDFNYAGVVNATDFAALAANFNLGTTVPTAAVIASATSTSAPNNATSTSPADAQSQNATNKKHKATSAPSYAAVVEAVPTTNSTSSAQNDIAVRTFLAGR